MPSGDGILDPLTLCRYEIVLLENERWFGRTDGQANGALPRILRINGGP